MQKGAVSNDHMAPMIQALWLLDHLRPEFSQAAARWYHSKAFL